MPKLLAEAVMSLLELNWHLMEPSLHLAVLEMPMHLDQKLQLAELEH